MKKIFPLILIFIVLPIGLLMLLWHDRCKETILTTLVSPDGERLAFSNYKDCGPAVPIATEVRLGIRDARGERNIKAGTTQVLLLQGQIETRLKWRAARELSVEYPRGSVLVSRRPSVDDVLIKFSDY